MTQTTERSRPRVGKPPTFPETQTLERLDRRYISSASSAIRDKWSASERHRRQKMAARKQQALLNDLQSRAPSNDVARIA